MIPQMKSTKFHCDYPSFSLATEQKKDPELKAILENLKDGYLPEDPKSARKIAAESVIFGILDGLLCFVDWKKPRRR